MKKIFTLLMLSIFAVMNVNAAEETLWTGDVELSYGGWQPDAQEPAFLTQADFAAFEIGQKLHFYVIPNNVSEGILCRFTDWGRSERSLGVDDRWLWYEEGLTHDVVLEVTSGVKSAVAANGFAVCGNQAHLVKVTKEYTITDNAPKLLWTGSKELTGWTPGDGLNLNLKDLGVTSEGNLYLLVDHAGDLRITRNSNGWENWPSEGFNHCTGNIDANNIIKVELPQDFVDAVTEGEGDGYWHEIVLWGDGLTIKGIATTKETLLCPVTTDALGYATYGSSYTLALDLLPEGLKAFTANQEGATLSFAKKTEAVGPGTGLLIQGEANTTYYLPAKTDDTEPAYNALSANLKANKLADLWKENDENYVFLMKKNTTGTGNIEFKKLNDTDLVVPANKAYVQVSPSVFTTSAHALSISFCEGEVTGISEATLLNINEVIKNNNVYDLSGRRVAKPTKGLYIVNGKKVVIK